MSDSRIVTIRKSSIDQSKISFPLLFLNTQFGYSLPSILRTIHYSFDISYHSINFPYGIQEYYWIQEGIPGKRPWFALGILQNGSYFLYKAYMNMPLNTFLENGHMDLWVSYKFSDIINYAMDTLSYSEYLNSTSPDN
jgi:hypothetical protein